MNNEKAVKFCIGYTTIFIIPEGFSNLKTEGLGAFNAQISMEIWQRSVRTGLPKSFLKRKVDLLQMAISQIQIFRGAKLICSKWQRRQMQLCLHIVNWILNKFKFYLKT